MLPAEWNTRLGSLGSGSRTLIAYALIFLGAIAPQPAMTQGVPGNLLPSEAMVLMLNAVENRSDATTRTEMQTVTARYLPRVVTDNLMRFELFKLGDIYMFALMPEEARDVFLPFLDGDDLYSRAAWQRIIQIRFRAFDMYEQVLKDMESFRKRFPPVPVDREYLFSQVRNIGGMYTKQERHEDVVEAITTELDALDYTGAYKSFELPGAFMSSYVAIGKKKLAMEQLKNAIAGLGKTLAQRCANPPDEDYNYPLPSERFHYFYPPAVQSIGWKQQNDQLQALIAKLELTVKEFT